VTLSFRFQKTSPKTIATAAIIQETWVVETI